jgi:hypothetical protein
MLFVQTMSFKHFILDVSSGHVYARAFRAENWRELVMHNSLLNHLEAGKLYKLILVRSELCRKK